MNTAPQSATGFDWRRLLLALGMGLVYDFLAKTMLVLMAGLDRPAGYRDWAADSPRLAGMLWDVLLLGTTPLLPALLLGWGMVRLFPARRWLFLPVVLLPSLVTLLWGLLENAGAGLVTDLLNRPWLLTIPLTTLGFPLLFTYALAPRRA